MDAGPRKALRSVSSRRWTLAVSGVLIAVFVAIGVIQTHQIKLLDNTIFYNEENISWVFFQLEQEELMLADGLRQAQRYPDKMNVQALRERYEIFVSRFSLMQSMRISPFVAPLAVQTRTVRMIEQVINDADAFLSENSQVALTPDVINQLLDKLEQLADPTHDMTLMITQLMVDTINLRNRATREQVHISIALTVFQGLLMLVFAAMLIRQVRSLEKRSHELGQATDEIRLLNSELEERVRQRTAQLEAANRELEAFSYSVSHDLRSPLKSIDGFSHLLARSIGDKAGEKGAHYLNRIRNGVRQMGELIDGLLSLAQLSRDKLQFDVVDLADIARGIEKEFREREPDRQAHILIQKTMPVRGDQRLLSVLLQNLLGNAWKFTSRRELARIEVGSQPGEAQEAGETVYFIKDNGAGFDMAYAEKLFGTFQRLHSPAEFAGTGIGLATVKRVVDRHGGRVWALGKEGEGAIFYFTLSNVRSAD